MRWQGRQESNNVEDRRGQGSSGLRRVPLRGPGGIIILLVVMVAGYYGVDLTPLLDQGVDTAGQSQSYQPSPEEEEMARFSAVALKMTEEAWHDIFQKQGLNYTPPDWFFITAQPRRPAVTGSRPWGLFIVRPTRRFT